MRAIIVNMPKTTKRVVRSEDPVRLDELRRQLRRLEARLRAAEKRNAAKRTATRFAR